MFHVAIQAINSNHPVLPTALCYRLQLHALEQRSAEQAHSVLELTATNSKQAEEIGRLKLSIKEGEKAKRELDR